MTQLQIENIDEFKAQFLGDVLLPGDAGYDDVRQIWNAMIDRRPALIARCTSPEDVVQAVKFARKHRLLVSIRGGGHNIAGNAICDDGIMIDVSPMKGVQVDPNARRATVEPGCTLADFDAVSTRPRAWPA
jgi:FAD/FMN-containing dehydrogenase